MALLAQLVVIGLLVGALWWACQPRYVFVVRIDHGQPCVTRGKVTPTFLREVGQACGDAEVRRGWVGGVRRGKQVALAFSRSIPQACRQRLRNQWQLHG
jgi:hypothetical protein